MIRNIGTAAVCAAALLAAAPGASAQGLLGQIVDTVCGQCGAGAALDDVHDGIKDAVPIYGDTMDGIDHLGREAQVESLGPLLSEAMRHSRDDARRAGTSPIPFEVRQFLLAYYPAWVIDGVEFRVGQGHELSVQANSFRFGDARAVALLDTVIFSDNSQLSDMWLWAHEIAHIQQYKQWGTLDFAKRYVRDYASVETEADRMADQAVAAYNAGGVYPSPGYPSPGSRGGRGDANNSYPNNAPPIYTPAPQPQIQPMIQYGNICRIGYYYQFVQPAPLGQSCYAPSFNAWGMISNW